MIFIISLWCKYFLNFKKNLLCGFADSWSLWLEKTTFCDIVCKKKLNKCNNNENKSKTFISDLQSKHFTCNYEWFISICCSCIASDIAIPIDIWISENYRHLSRWLTCRVSHRLYSVIHNFCQPSCVIFWAEPKLTYKQRLALPIEFRYSNIPIAIGLSNSYRNIGLTYLSDFNYRTSYFGLPIVR
jgi:hypothetical protein